MRDPIQGFTHILLDDEGVPIGAAKDFEVINEWELGVIQLFSWPDGHPAEYRPTAGYSRIEVSDASSDIYQEVQFLLASCLARV